MFNLYFVSPIAIALVVIYAVSFALYKTKVIRISTHRKVWNVLLLVTFLTTAVFGLILAVRRDFALLFGFPINLLFWHVEAGVVMTVVSVFHLSWHLRYYRDLFRTGREKARAQRALERPRTEDAADGMVGDEQERAPGHTLATGRPRSPAE